MTASVDQLQHVRDRLLPMLEQVAREYAGRVPGGYPAITDAVRQGVIGIEIDSSYSMFVTSDDAGLVVDFYVRSSRGDARSSASRAKFAGMPEENRRPLPDHPSDQYLRNLLDELLARWNTQPGIIRITDT